MLTLVAGLYIVSDPICVSFPVEVHCYSLNRFFLSEVPRHSRVVTALGYLGLKGFVLGDVQTIFVI